MAEYCPENSLGNTRTSMTSPSLSACTPTPKIRQECNRASRLFSPYSTCFYRDLTSQKGLWGHWTIYLSYLPYNYVNNLNYLIINNEMNSKYIPSPPKGVLIDYIKEVCGNGFNTLLYVWQFSYTVVLKIRCLSSRMWNYVIWWNLMC